MLILQPYFQQTAKCIHVWVPSKKKRRRIKVCDPHNSGLPWRRGLTSHLLNNNLFEVNMLLVEVPATHRCSCSSKFKLKSSTREMIHHHLQRQICSPIFGTCGIWAESQESCPEVHLFWWHSTSSVSEVYWCFGRDWTIQSCDRTSEAATSETFSGRGNCISIKYNAPLGVFR